VAVLDASGTTPSTGKPNARGFGGTKSRTSRRGPSIARMALGTPFSPVKYENDAFWMKLGSLSGLSRGSA
jgi:hypothetical protein